MTEITLQNISKVYGAGSAAVKAVDDIDLTIASGDFFFLLGPSGCGKTTLLRMIAGLIEPTTGRILFGDRDVTRLSVEHRNAAMVFQNYALWPHMTVAQNVEFGPRMRGLPAAQRREIAQANLSRVQMEAYLRRKPNQLSGGQQQRVALARALAAQGQCLLLDEPLSNLDARLRLHMRGQLRQLVKSTGTTAIYVTHDQKEALSMADHIAVMNAGRIVQVGAPQELYNRPASRFVADFLGEANFIDGAVAAGAPLTIKTPVGDLGAATVAPTLAVGAGVTCCIRPERVRIAIAGRPSGQGAVALPATVTSHTYLGELHQYVARLANGATWRISMLADHAPALPVGQTVELHIASQDVAILTQ